MSINFLKLYAIKRLQTLLGTYGYDKRTNRVNFLLTKWKFSRRRDQLFF